MGLRADRAKFMVYLASGGLAGLAGVILAAQFGAGQPIRGWLAAVCRRRGYCGATVLTGGSGSVITTLAGVLLLGILFNVLNFENGLGWISLSAYWQSVIRVFFCWRLCSYRRDLPADASPRDLRFTWKGAHRACRDLRHKSCPRARGLPEGARVDRCAPICSHALGGRHCCGRRTLIVTSCSRTKGNGRNSNAISSPGPQL
ncbi:hypothetical protein NKI59_25485 [Mesorhizobium sp. M0598]|uniref:ABC transporter permease n=1 Tax=Mesorhizobium sp. M0598 TaxID=2956968 RepID=UPI00333D201B